ncbi:hypothetical protein MON38_20075 [Hymenobacter sp. DH14]|uniref:DUF4384 domain-containing protein n=1 Tax=Hymenobacter cyanobacteriorum TaxID=2926463 RepID=A0A9X2AHD0_9BACT|nr:hypothetical protein [Hymenobacter cyanobacteriorum]MCI1189727.1 hypothetical protein [Hymenobacter cyanobacteriorum]
MKTFLIALWGIFALASAARGQSPPLGSGLYRSAADFRQHRLALAVDCKTATHKLRLHEFSGKPTMTVIHGGKPYQVAKDSLFGFRDCDGRDYRFASNNQHYPILNPGEELLIYKVEQPTVGKNPGYVHLYFSPTAAAPIQPLTLLAVKKAFPSNHRFHDLLDAQFQGGDLAAYDALHRMTKLNWLLRQSQPATVSH